MTPPDSQLKGACYCNGFNPCTYQVETWFQNLRFKWVNLCRYTVVASPSSATTPSATAAAPPGALPPLPPNAAVSNVGVDPHHVGIDPQHAPVKVVLTLSNPDEAAADADATEEAAAAAVAGPVSASLLVIDVAGAVQRV
jgi:hypothetical protein